MEADGEEARYEKPSSDTLTATKPEMNVQIASAPSTGTAVSVTVAGATSNQFLENGQIGICL